MATKRPAPPTKTSKQPIVKKAKEYEPTFDQGDINKGTANGLGKDWSDVKLGFTLSTKAPPKNGGGRWLLRLFGNDDRDSYTNVRFRFDPHQLPWPPSQYDKDAGGAATNEIPGVPWNVRIPIYTERDGDSQLADDLIGLNDRVFNFFLNELTDEEVKWVYPDGKRPSQEELAARFKPCYYIADTTGAMYLTLKFEQDFNKKPKYRIIDAGCGPMAAKPIHPKYISAKEGLAGTFTAYGAYVMWTHSQIREADGQVVDYKDYMIGYTASVTKVIRLSAKQAEKFSGPAFAIQDSVVFEEEEKTDTAEDPMLLEFFNADPAPKKDEREETETPTPTTKDVKGKGKVNNGRGKK